jgi:hypothetical protein
VTRQLSEDGALIARWVKVAYALFVALLVPVYWLEYGPRNFLWGSDIALLVTLVAVWRESALLASMMTLGVLLPELAWTLDVLARAILGPEIFPMQGTRYMFDPAISRLTRWLSLFHLGLPALLLWLVYRLGYQRRALLLQTLVAWVILPFTYFIADPSANINWVHGFGREPQTWMPGPVYLGLLMLVFPVTLYLPTHWLLARVFPRPRGRSSARASAKPDRQTQA